MLMNLPVPSRKFISIIEVGWLLFLKRKKKKKTSCNINNQLSRIGEEIILVEKSVATSPCLTSFQH